MQTSLIAATGFIEPAIEDELVMAGVHPIELGWNGERLNQLQQRAIRFTRRGYRKQLLERGERIEVLAMGVA